MYDCHRGDADNRVSAQRSGCGAEFPFSSKGVELGGLSCHSRMGMDVLCRRSDIYLFPILISNYNEKIFI